MKKLFVSLVILAFIGCGGGENSSTEDNSRVSEIELEISDVQMNNQQLDAQYKTYSLPLSVDASISEDTEVTFTLCFAQEPRNGKALPVGTHYYSNYEAVDYKVISCSSSQRALTSGQNNNASVDFDVYTILRDTSFKQAYFGEGDLYLLNDLDETVYSIGSINVEEIVPFLNLDNINYTRLEPEFSSGNSMWEILGPQKPYIFRVPMTFTVEMNGSGADEVIVEFYNPYVKVEMEMLTDAPVQPTSTFVNIPFTILDGEGAALNKIVFTPSELIVKAYDMDNIESDVPVSVIPTTDTETPYIFFTVIAEFKYSDIDDLLLPHAKSGNEYKLYLTSDNYSYYHCFGNISFVTKALIENIQMTANVNSQGYSSTKTVVAELNMIDFIDDLYDMYAEIYKSETTDTYLPRNLIRSINFSATPPEVPIADDSFQAFEYKLLYEKSAGDKRSIRGEMKLQAGVYTLQENSIYSIKGEALADAGIYILSNYTNLMEGNVTVKANTDDTTSMDYTLKIFGKTVVNEGMATGSRLQYTKNISFEKEFTLTQNGKIAFLTYTFDLGGRGEIGIGTPDGISDMVDIRMTSEQIEGGVADGTTAVGLTGTFAAKPYCDMSAHAFGGLGFSYKYSFLKMDFAVEAKTGVAAKMILADVNVNPHINLFLGLASDGSDNYLVITADFKAPVNYTLAHGDIYQHSRVYLQVVKVLFDEQNNRTLAHIDGISEKK